MTPALHGRVPLVLTDATVWGQKLDRLEGVLAFKDDRIAIGDAPSGGSADASATFGGVVPLRGRRLRFDLDVKGLPLARSRGCPTPGPRASSRGHASGEGLIDKPTLAADGRIAGPRVRRTPARARGPRDRAPRAGGPRRLEREGRGAGGGRHRDRLARRRRARAALWHARAEFPSLAPLAGLLGLPDEAKFDGRLSAEASLKPARRAGRRSKASGRISAAHVHGVGPNASRCAEAERR